MTSNYHYLEHHSLIGVQWLGKLSDQTREIGDLTSFKLATVLGYTFLLFFLSYFFNDSFLVIILYFKL